MKIAIDFDGTIVENKYPAIGREKVFAFETMKALQQKGHQLVLWTYRSGKELKEAVDFCKDRGVEFYAVNKNYPEEKPEDQESRKVLADIYIDDRNLGGFPGWSEVWQMLHPESQNEKEMLRKMVPDKKGLFSRLRHMFSK